MALFAFLLYPLGLVIALFVLIIVSSNASPEFTWSGALANAAVLIVFWSACSSTASGCSFPVWPTLFN